MNKNNEIFKPFKLDYKRDSNFNVNFGRERINEIINRIEMLKIKNKNILDN